MAGRKPDYIIKVLAVESQRGNRVGAAWKNRDGSIAITLDVGVVIDWRMRDDCSLMLFPNTEKP